MMWTEKLQRQRFELKYIVSEDKAHAARDFCAAYLDLDAYGRTRPNHSYPVHSLYLDSPDLRLYQSTINGDKNRYKLRLRFYENLPDAPIGFEIKRRCNNVIIKRRARVKRAAVARLLQGDAPVWQDLAEDSPQQFSDLQEFLRLTRALRASPKAHVAYLREAWERYDHDSVRVTFDRQVRTAPEFTLNFTPVQQNPVQIFLGGVVLELKFTNRFPTWLREMTRALHLRPCSAAKYVDGVEELKQSNRVPWHIAYA